MFELDAVFSKNTKVFDTILKELTPKRRQRMEACIAAIQELALSRRYDQFLLGKHLNEMLLCCHEQDGHLAQLLPQGFQPERFHMPLRLYQRFQSFESVITQVHVGVQIYVANHAYCPTLMREIITLAKQGQEVSMKDLDEIRSRLTHEPTEDDTPIQPLTTTDSQLADLADVPPTGDETPFHRATVPREGGASNWDDDTDPWDDDDGEVLEPSTRTNSAPRPTATVPKVDRVDLDDMRVKLIRNLDHELTGAFRSIEDFCETYHIRKGGWFLRFKSGADKARDAIKDWQKEKLDRH